MSKTLMVGSLDELYEALAAANGGETILLEGGTYGHLYIGNKSGYDVNFPDTVTIASADLDDPAIFTSSKVVLTSNLTFDGITFDYTYADADSAQDGLALSPFGFASVENLTIRNSTFDGDVATGLSATQDGYGYGTGLRIKDSVGITLENNEFHTFQRGLIVDNSQDIVIQGNDLHSLRHDGMNFVEVQNILIEGNYIHDFIGRPGWEDHRDMIQFWTKGTTTPNTDIIIRGNHLDIGEGSHTQSIFMRNEEVDTGNAGEEMFYQNVLIEENVIVNAHLHGITVGETDGLTIQNNTVIQAGEGPVGANIPRINLAEASQDVVVSGNATSEITGFTDQSGWTIDRNVFVQNVDASQIDYYSDIFIASTVGSTDGMHMPLATSDSVLVEVGAGATVTREGPSEGAAAFQIIPDPDNPAIITFNASASNVPEGSQYLWEFSDGTNGEGVSFARPFPEGGEYEATLTVVTPDNGSDVTSVTVMIRGSQILTMSEGGFTTHGYGDSSFSEVEAVDETGALVMAPNGLMARVAMDNIRPLATADEFSITMALEPNGSGQDGQVFWLHQILVVSVNGGKLQVVAYAKDGNKLVMHSEAELSKSTSQDIELNLQDGTLTLLIDGNVSSQMDVGPGLNEQLSQDLYFGTPWGEDNFGGTISNFEVEVSQSDYEEAQLLFENTIPDLPNQIESVDLIDLHLGKDSVDLISGQSLEALPVSYIEPILGEDEFHFSFDLTGTEADSKGDVMRVKGAFWMKVQDEGELVLWVREEDGDVTALKTSGAELADLETSRIDIMLEDDILAIYVDDVVRAATVMDTGITDNALSDLNFGARQSRTTFDGNVSNLTIRVDIADEMQMMNLMALPQFESGLDTF